MAAVQHKPRGDVCESRGQSVDDFGDKGQGQTDGRLGHGTYFFSAFLLGHSMVNGLDGGLDADNLIKRGHKPDQSNKRYGGR